MSTFRYRFVGAPQFDLDNLIEPGAAATTLLLARSPWTSVALIDDTRQQDLDDLMQRSGYIPDPTGPVIAVNGDHIMGSESVVFADASLGSLQIELPQSPSRLGDELVFHKLDGTTNSVTLVPVGGDTVAGGASLVLQQTNEAVRLTSDSSTTDWRILSSRRAADIIYNPTGTGLSSVNVQDVIGEVLSTTSGVTLVTPFGVTQHATITAALTFAFAGSVVVVGPGLYAESFTIPAGVGVQGAFSGTTVIQGATPTGTRVTLSANAFFRSCVVMLPTDATPAIFFAGNFGERVSISEIALIGQGPLGVAVRNSGFGSMLIDRTDYINGPCGIVFDATGGFLLLSQILMSGGSAASFVSLSNGASMLADSLGVGVPVTVTDVLTIATASVVATNVNSQTGQNSVHITNNGASVELRSPRFNASQFDLLVDPGLTSGTCQIIGGELAERKISAPGVWVANSSLSFTFQDDSEISVGRSSYNIWGDFRVGHIEQGSESSFGKGGNLTRGIVVLSTDATAGPASDGGNFIDLTVAAVSRTGSTFTFQGNAANYTILAATTLSDATDFLKVFGWRSDQLVAGVGGIYVFEIWDGVAWVGVGVHSTSAVEFYSYANRVFLRANSSENLRLGITRETTWVAKSINGITAYWIRVRIAALVTTLPLFEHWELGPAHSHFNADGKESFFGLAMYRSTLFAAGNVYGETGSVVDTSVTVGSGGAPTGWSHTIKNSFLNSNGDAIQYQFVLPRGICTAFPLRFVLYYTSSADTTVTVSLSILNKEVTGVLVADPFGGITPVVRSDANTPTLTAAPGIAQTFSLPTTTLNKVHQVIRDGFEISSIYQGDMLFLRFGMDDDGPANANVTIVALEISGVMWTLGEAL